MARAHGRRDGKSSGRAVAVPSAKLCPLGCLTHLCTVSAHTRLPRLRSSRSVIARAYRYSIVCECESDQEQKAIDRTCRQCRAQDLTD